MLPLPARGIHAASPVSVVNSVREERLRKLRENAKGLEELVQKLKLNCEREKAYKQELQVSLNEWEISGRTRPLRLPGGENSPQVFTMANAKASRGTFESEKGGDWIYARGK